MGYQLNRKRIWRNKIYLYYYLTKNPLILKLASRKNNVVIYHKLPKIPWVY